MNKKLRCIVVDDDSFMINMIEEQCIESDYVIITNTFHRPKDFLDAAPQLDYDICLIDICMPKMDGFTVAKMLEGKPIIFMTSVYEKVPDALGLSPIDIVLKPMIKTRLEVAFKKAYCQLLGERNQDIIADKKRHDFFAVSGLPGKIKIVLDDIVYVKTDEVDSRNKCVLMRDGTNHVFLNYTMDELLNTATNLARVNASELISVDVFDVVQQDEIVLKGVLDENGNAKRVFLTRRFKKSFLDKVKYL
jgi:DNA-binding LytR/AlgR family response regulator